MVFGERVEMCMKQTVTIFLFLLILVPMGCGQSVASVQFFDVCNKVANTIKTIQNIPIDTIQKKVFEDNAIYNVEIYDYTERSKYITKHYDNIIKSIESLKSTVSSPIDLLADDAEFVQLVSYLAISYPGAPTIKIFEEKTVEFIESGREINLDKRTINTFHDIGTFNFFLNTKIWENSGQEVIANLIKDGDYRSIFIQTLIKVVYLDNGEFDKAKVFFNREKEKLNPDHREYLKKFIQEAEVFIKKQKQLQ
jgi:hypothetical protein